MGKSQEELGCDWLVAGRWSWLLGTIGGGVGGWNILQLGGLGEVSQSRCHFEADETRLTDNFIRDWRGPIKCMMIIVGAGWCGSHQLSPSLEAVSCHFKEVHTNIVPKPKQSTFLLMMHVLNNLGLSQLSKIVFYIDSLPWRSSSILKIREKVNCFWLR